MIEGTLKFYEKIRELYFDFLHATVKGGVPFVLALFGAVLALVLVFMVGHVFWNYVSFFPLNVYLSYMIYYSTGSKVLTALLWLTFIPWCFWVEDYQRRQRVFDFTRDELLGGEHVSLKLAPYILNRFIRLLTMMIINAGLIIWLVYMTCHSYIDGLLQESKTISEANEKKGLSILIIIFVIGIIFFVFITRFQSRSIFENKKLMVDDIVYSLLSGDVLYKIGFVFAIVRIIIWVVILASMFSSFAINKGENSGLNIIVPIVCIVYDINCCTMKAYLRDWEKHPAKISLTRNI